MLVVSTSTCVTTLKGLAGRTDNTVGVLVNIITTGAAKVNHGHITTFCSVGLIKFPLKPVPLSVL